MCPWIKHARRIPVDNQQSVLEDNTTNILNTHAMPGKHATNLFNETQFKVLNIRFNGEKNYMNIKVQYHFHHLMRL